MRGKIIRILKKYTATKSNIINVFIVKFKITVIRKKDAYVENMGKPTNIYTQEKILNLKQKIQLEPPICNRILILNLRYLKFSKEMFVVFHIHKFFLNLL